MAINSSSTLALTGSKDGSVHVVNITTGRVCASINFVLFCVSLYWGMVSQVICKNPLAVH